MGVTFRTGVATRRIHPPANLMRRLVLFSLGLLVAALAPGGLEARAQTAPATPDSTKPLPAAAPASPSSDSAAAPSPLPADDATIQLERYDVTATNEDGDYDATGMGSVEQQMRDEPFSNDLINADEFMLDADGVELAAELAAVAETSPADRIVGEDRLNLRGFPTPMLRNGFIQLGIPEVLNTGQTIVIQGPLVPVLGRAAPGGIQNFMSARPRPKEQLRLATSAGWGDGVARQRANLEWTGPLVPKKNWQRLAVDWTRSTGPEDFADQQSLAASASLTVRHSRAASTMVSVDYREIRAQAAAGIPEYIPLGATKIVGPYRSLARFNANGPDAGLRRRSAAFGAVFDAQPTKALAVRAGIEGWWRRVEQDRFTTSQYNLATGLLAGTREPRHLEQPQQALAAQLEATLRFRRWQAEHKLMASASHTWGRYLREERALSLAERNALPADVRRFDPFAPNWFWPAYDAARYSRILTDRLEHARYASVEVSDRAAWQRGRIVLTTGLRYDQVSLEVEDRRPGSPSPRTHDRTGQWSSHAGVNWQLKAGKLLAFATTSTAFDPSTPVDARTGRIQNNETTLGYETGLRGRTLAGQLNYSASGYVLLNQHIARRNPLYNDPIADANQTQPQLVASGEERFAGGRVELRWQASKAVALGLKGSHVRAVTTASPDLPQEVGRPLTRLPSFNVSANVRYRAPNPAGGFSCGASWQYLDGYVANHEDARREFLDYPGYGLVSVNAGWSWRRKKGQLELETGVRNVFDRDLLASHARLGAGRELSLSARMVF